MKSAETPSSPGGAAPLRIGGRTLARNTALNFAGQMVPIAVAIFTIPYIIHGMGMERFGVLSLAWVLVGYFSLFNLGLGRATIKFVAELLGRGESRRVPAVLWTSFLLQAGLGILGSVALAVSTPVLIHRFLHISPGLAVEVRTVFYILAASIPIVFTMGVFRGALEASQRFDLVNAVSVPSGAASFLIPAAGIALGFGLRGIVFFLVLAKLATAGAYFAACCGLYPNLKHELALDREVLRPLLSYGGWVSVSSALSPVFSYSERLIIASLLSFSAVGLYTAPHEMLSRAFIFPASLGMTVFPAFSAYGRHAKEEVSELFLKSVKWLLLVTTPVVIILTVFAGTILQLWLGRKFESQAVAVFQILAIAYFVSAFGQVAFAVLYGLGRPDLKAKLDLLLLPIFLGLCFLLIRGFGINGAAGAKLLASCINVGCLFWLVQRMCGVSMRKTLFKTLARGMVITASFAGIAFVLAVSCHSLLLMVAAMLLSTAFYLVAQWKLVLDTSERAVVLSLSSRLLNRSAATG